MSNRTDLPFVYGRVISFGGAEGDYLLHDPNDEASGFRWIPVGWPVTVLQIGSGVTVYGSGKWCFVVLVDPNNDTEIRQGWLPFEVLGPRLDLEEAMLVPNIVSDIAKQIQQNHLNIGYRYEWPGGGVGITLLETRDEEIIIHYDHREGKLTGLLQSAEDGYWKLVGQWEQGEDGGDFELIFEPELTTATGWWNHGPDTVPDEHSLRLLSD